MRVDRRLALQLAAAAGASTLLRADEAWPSRNIRSIVPFPAGSATDGLARFVSGRLGTRLGRTFVMDNIAGANGALASRACAQAASDGYTVMFGGNSTHAANLHLMRDPGYDPIADFTPVSLVGIAPLALVVRADFPAATLAEFIAHARANPGRLNYGTGNTSMIAAAQLLKSMAGVQAEMVAYRGAPAAVADLLGGRLQFIMNDLTTTISHVRSGALRALAVTSARRVPLLPDLPTMAEAGLTGYDYAAWIAVFGPRGMPRLVVERLAGLIGELMGGAEGTAFASSIGMVAAHCTPAELAAFQRREIEQWGRIVREANLPRE